MLHLGDDRRPEGGADDPRERPHHRQSYTSIGGADPETGTTLLVLPLFHIYGLSTVMVTSLYDGTEVISKTLPVARTLLEAADLRRFALERVPSYAHPREVFFVDDLPRSGTRKVRRYELEDRARELLEGPLASSEEL